MISPRETLPGRPKVADEKATELSPFIHEFFLVEGDGFRGMAYCDEDGKWRTAYRDEELPGEVCIAE